MIYHNPFLFLWTLLLMVVFYEFLSEKFKGQPRMKRYFVFGIVIIFAAILLEFILGLFFESPRSEIYSTVLLGGDLRFLMSIVAGVMFIEFSYETLERKGLNEYPARVSASVIFMIIYAVSDLLLKAIFNV